MAISSKLFIYDDVRGKDVELGGVDSFEFKISSKEYEDQVLGKWDNWVPNGGYTREYKGAYFERLKTFIFRDDISYRGPARDTEIRSCGMRVRDGSYTPEQLGLNMPGLNWIHIGRCVQFGEGEDELYNAFYNALAHAHHESGQICMPDGLYVFSAPGVVDDVLIHEYCHILAGEYGHMSNWVQQMARYGLDDYPWSTYVYR